MMQLRVGIAGHGAIGKVRHQYCDLHPSLKVVAVYDQIYKKVSNTLDKEIKFHSNLDEFISEPLDILFVCLPNDLAPDITIAGLQKGLHVFCEKPPGRTVSDLLRVIQVEKERPKQKLMYGFNHRYHDSVQDALVIIKNKSLGDVRDLRGVYGKSKIIRFDTNEWRTQKNRSGGGILLDQGIHMVDMMRLFAGEFTQIHSFIKNDFWHHDVEDNAYALMKTDTNIVALLHSSATQWRHRFLLEITLSKGSLILSGILTNSRSYGAETLTVVYANPDDSGDPKEQTTRYNQDNSWKKEINEFVSCIINDIQVINGSSAEALKTMELVFSIYSADKSWLT
jgi:predicted dehydrogenase